MESVIFVQIRRSAEKRSLQSTLLEYLKTNHGRESVLVASRS